MKTWNVRVHTNPPFCLGQVQEKNEELARCAALSKFGIPEDEDTDPMRRGIRLEDDFDVSAAS
jgi:hypothetical protein